MKKNPRQPRTAKDLAAKAGPRLASSGSARVCVICDDIDPFDHIMREIPASMIGLAERLAASGLEVVLYVAGSDAAESAKVEELARHFSTMHNIKVVKHEYSKDNVHRSDSAQSRSLDVYTYLKENDFGVVYFPLEGGLPYYSLLSKEAGLRTLRSTIVVVAHSPLEWTSEVDRFFPAKLEQARIAFMEKYCAKQADSLVSINSRLLEWFRKKKWELPRESCVLPALAPAEWQRNVPETTSPSRNQAPELILLAGNRYRDGTTLFCDALDELARERMGDLDVTIIGEFGKILGEHTGGLFIRRARRWPFKLHLTPTTTLIQGIRYAAARRNSIAVIPNFGSATGFIISECLRLGVRFVATAVGGNLNQMDSRREKAVLTQPNAAALSARIKKAISHPAIPSPALDEDEKAARWIIHHRKCVGQLITAAKPSAKKQKLPLVSVIITHHDRPQYLTQVIASIRDQDYKNLEVILIDDGSKLAESQSALDRLDADFAKRGWKIIRGENRYVGAARNTGVRASRGEYIVFVDDDNALFPHAVSTFVQAAQHSRADVCTALAKTFYDVYVPGSVDRSYVSYIPLGGSLDLGFLTNCFGDTISIYRRSIFDKIGYQFEKFGYMVEDHEFFVRILLAGLKMTLIPECLFWYRVSTRGRYRSSHYYDNQIPIMEAYRKHHFKGLDYVYDLFLGQNMGSWQTESLRSNLYYSPSDHNYLKLSELEPNSREALQLLAEIAAAEGRPDTAISVLASRRFDDFAGLAKSVLSADQRSDSALLEFGTAIAMAKPVTSHDLASAVVATSRPALEPPISYTEGEDTLFLEAQGTAITVAAIPAICPASTISVASTVSLQQSGETSVEVMIMLCPMHDDPVVSVQSAVREPAEGNSGWIAIERAWIPATVEARLTVPSQRPLNLVLAVRASQVPKIKVFCCFSGTTVRISARDQVTRRISTNPLLHAQRARQWTDSQRRAAKLITHYPSELPLLLFPKKIDEGLFLRPSELGPVVSVLDRAFPAFGRAVTARVEISHEEAGPFEFGVAVFAPESQVQWQKAGPRNALVFSGWVTVSERFKIHDVTARLAEKVPGSLSVALAIRLPRGARASPANAFFRKVIFSWED